MCECVLGMCMRIEVENMVSNEGHNETIFAFFKLGIYEEEAQESFLSINGCMIVADATPTVDGSLRLVVRFPFLPKPFRPDEIKHLLYFMDGGVKKDIISEALAQYREQFSEV